MQYTSQKGLVYHQLSVHGYSNEKISKENQKIKAVKIEPKSPTLCGVQTRSMGCLNTRFFDYDGIITRSVALNVKMDRYRSACKKVLNESAE